MKSISTLMMVFLIIVTAAWSATPPALINYQGVLRNASGVPRNGNFDMEFRFFSDAGVGTLLLTDTHDSGAPSGQVAVSNGLFTAQLGSGTITAGSEPNLAESFRDNAAVWLEIQVGTETLNPRVQVIAAAYAQNAKSLDGNDASAFATAGHLQSPAAGGTGINTSAAPAGNILYTSSPGTWSTLAAGDNGKLLQSTGSGLQWVTQSAINDGDWTVAGSNMYSSVSGNVGIGTAAPEGKLHVNGPLYVDGIGSSHHLDIQQESCFISTSVDFWQSFTATTTAYLSRIELFGEPDLGSLTVRIYSGEGTSGTLLSTDSCTTDFAFTNKWYGCNISLPFRVTSGSIYTFDVSLGPHSYYFSDSNVYAGGQWSLNSNRDVAFRTYVRDTERILSVEGLGLRLNGALLDTSGDVGISGQVLQSTMTGTNWVNLSAVNNDWTISGVDMFSAVSGNVGIGSTNPVKKLQIGDVGTLGSEGMIRLESKTDTVGGSQRSWDIGVPQTGDDASQAGYSFVIDDRGYSGSSAPEFMIKWGEGKVGIGIIPTHLLTLLSDSTLKPGTNTWNTPSDGRLKKEIAPFRDGLAVIEKINPIRYKYNGLADTPQDLPAIGVLAQEIKEVAPYTVGTYKTRLYQDDTTETELYEFNSHALTFVLINAVKELEERTRSLAKNRIENGVTQSSGQKPASVDSSELLLPTVEKVSSDENPGIDAANGKATSSPGSHPVSPAGAAMQMLPAVEGVEPGDVLVIDPAGVGNVLSAGSLQADRLVVGVAAKFTVVEAGNGLRGVKDIPVVVAGITLVKVDATQESIVKGDLLIASPIPGHAMKSPEPVEPGTVIGKALGSLESGTGFIMIVVMLR